MRWSAVAKDSLSLVVVRLVTAIPRLTSRYRGTYVRRRSRAGGISREASDLQSDPSGARSQEPGSIGLAGPNLAALVAAKESDPPLVSEHGTLLSSPSEFASPGIAPDAAASKKGLDYRLARTVDDRLAPSGSFIRLMCRAGLGESHSSGMRVTPHQIEPTSQIFVGLLRDEVARTVSLIGDGQLGLPMESMFAGEVRELRESGQRLAEVSCLADRRQDTRRFLATFRELTRLMAQFARYEGIGNLLVTVNPRHVRFYTHYLGFVPVSRRIADCPHVKNRPAVCAAAGICPHRSRAARLLRRLFRLLGRSL